VVGVDLSGLPIYDLVRPVCLSNAVGQTTFAFRWASSLSEPIRPRLTGSSLPSPRRPLRRRIPSGDDRIGRLVDTEPMIPSATIHTRVDVQFASSMRTSSRRSETAPSSRVGEDVGLDCLASESDRG
jgi:hypothetical protein